MYERNCRTALEALGLNPKRHLPTDGTTAVIVTLEDGRDKKLLVRVWVNPKLAGEPLRKHRLMGQCPYCADPIPLGRLWQHMKVHRRQH